MTTSILIVGYIIWASLGISLTIKAWRNNSPASSFNIDDLIICILIGLTLGPVFQIVKTLASSVPWDKEIWPPKDEE